MNITPYQHREATALVAEAWSILESSPNANGRKEAVALMDKARAILAPAAPVANPQPRIPATPVPSRKNHSRRKPVETPDDWFESAAECGRAIGVSRTAVLNACNGHREPVVRGVRVQFSDYKLRSRWEMFRKGHNGMSTAKAG